MSSGRGVAAVGVDRDGLLEHRHGVADRAGVAEVLGQEVK
jgi:hypothetical protein